MPARGSACCHRTWPPIRIWWSFQAGAPWSDRHFLLGLVGAWPRMSGLGADLGADLGGEAIDREPVAVDAEAAQRGEGGLGGEGMMAEILAGVDVADVNLDGRDLYRHQRVMQRDRGVRIAAGI